MDMFTTHKLTFSKTHTFTILMKIEFLSSYSNHNEYFHKWQSNALVLARILKQLKLIRNLSRK